MTSDSTVAAPERESETTEKFGKLSFGVAKSIRYHSKLSGYYDALSRLISVVVLVGGSAALGNLVGSRAGPDLAATSSLALWSAAVVTIAAMLERAFSFGEKSRTHRDLYRRFCALSVAMTKRQHTIDTAALADFAAERLLIEMEEPAVKSTLNRICHNEEVRANGWTAEIYPVTPLAAWLCYIVSFK